MKRKIGVALMLTGLALCLLTPHAAHAFYNPSTGRWLSRDLVNERGFRTQALAALPKERGFTLSLDEDVTLYGFASGDPVAQVDILGLAKPKPSKPKTPPLPKTPKPPGNPCDSDQSKCKCCMVFAESRATEDACQQAIASVIENRMIEKHKTACEVVSERNGKEFNAYNDPSNPSYRTCCKGKCKNTPNGAQSETERQQAFSNCSPDFDASYGANFFARGKTPDWIETKINDGRAEELKVPGCTKMRFYYVEP